MEDTVRVACVIINNPAHAVDKCFSYLPQKDEKAGDWVKVPFGNGNKETDGVILSFDTVPKSDKLKHISCVVSPLLTEKEIELLSWIREEYICTYYDALKLLLPPGKGYSGAGNKTVKGVSVSDFSDAELLMEKLRAKAPAQARVLEIALQTDRISVADLAQFAGTTRAAVNALVDKGILKEAPLKIERNPVLRAEVKHTEKLKPTAEQKRILEYVTGLLDRNKSKTILLRGITGSGKTEVYLQCIEHVLKMGKQAIVLVPEISLTPQMTERFVSRFGKDVAILHSRLSFGERYDAWQSIKEGRVRLAVGARSAVFAPFDNLGMIVADEEHESSYKSEMNPKYDAREVAKFRCKQQNAVLMLASATPSMESAYKAVSGEYALVQIKNRYNAVSLPKADVVDMRFELARGNKSFLSFELQDAIAENIKKKEQTILFLNRRGFSTFVSCRKCGFAATCPECDIALTYHKYSDSLSCHYCGYTIPGFKFCPKCGSTQIRHFGIGTQRVEEEIHKLFPDASVLRMDLDTTRGKFAHADILKKFTREKTDILVGTQMITKGLDFPSVSLVGVLAADMMLYVDDYRACERTFQLITQVCGRAGRGDSQGRAIIQTYSPDHWVIECAKNQDFRSFYKQEILLRQKTDYPPFCDVVHMVVSGENANEVREKITDLTDKIIERFKEKGIGSTVLGPTPSPVSKIENRYRWRLIIKCRINSEIRSILREITKQDMYNKKSDCSISLDINANNML